MKDQYGYGPVRGLTGLRLKKHLSTVLLGAGDDMSSDDIVQEAGNVLNSTNSTLFDDLIALEAAIFDSAADFATCLDDMVTNYGASSEADLAAGYGTWLQTNHVALYNLMVAAYPGCFGSNEALYTAINGMMTDKTAYASALAQMVTLGSAWDGMLASGAPFACTPHAATGNLQADLLDLTNWILALKIPAGDGIRVASGDA